MNEWIPVEVYKPATAKSVLMYSKSGGVAEGYYSPTSGKWCQFRWSASPKVTHWMPLPEPPEEVRLK